MVGLCVGFVGGVVWWEGCLGVDVFYLGWVFRGGSCEFFGVGKEGWVSGSFVMGG